jgi:hypothetical protein
MTGRGWWDTVTAGDRTIFLPDAEPYTVRPVNYERCLAASWSRRMTSRLSIGVTGRYLHFSHYFDTSRIDDEDGASFDAGTIFDLTDGISIGVNLINLFSTDIDYAVYNDFTAVAYFSERPAGWASVRAGWNFRQRPVRQAYPPLPFGTPEGEAYEYGKYNAFTLGTGLLFRGVSFDIGARIDDRRDRMETPGIREIRGTTALGSATLSYSF